MKQKTDYCHKCKTKENLRSAGSSSSMICRPCGSKINKIYQKRYLSNPENKRLAHISVMRCYAKKYGYKLTKIK